MPRSISSNDLGISGASAVLTALDSACRSVNAPFFLVGALARDILLHHLRGVEKSPRMTRDVDVAVAVESWDHFDQLRQILFEHHGFQETRLPHRLQSREAVLVDLVPFGDVEDEGRHVSWPPDDAFALSVMGFREALQMTETVLLDELAIQVVPLVAFGPLKLVAWSERRLQTTRDAEDLCFVLMSFWEAETQRILDNHADLFEAEDGDTDFIGARAFGREASNFVSRSSALKSTLLTVLDREATDIHSSNLAVEMGRGCSYSYERRFEILLRFRRGLRELL